MIKDIVFFGDPINFTQGDPEIAIFDILSLAVLFDDDTSLTMGIALSIDEDSSPLKGSFVTSIDTEKNVDEVCSSILSIYGLPYQIEKSSSISSMIGDNSVNSFKFGVSDIHKAKYELMSEDHLIKISYNDLTIRVEISKK